MAKKNLSHKLAPQNPPRLQTQVKKPEPVPVAVVEDEPKAIDLVEDSQGDILDENEVLAEEQEEGELIVPSQSIEPSGFGTLPPGSLG